MLRVEPTPTPMGFMDMSTPRVNSPMPPTSRMAPKRNSTRVPGSRGAMVMDSRKTMAVIGSTEAIDSRIFSIRCLLIRMGSAPYFMKIMPLYRRNRAVPRFFMESLHRICFFNTDRSQK